MNDKHSKSWRHIRRRWMRADPPPWWPAEEDWPPTAPGWKRTRKRLFPRVLFGALGALLTATLVCSGAIYLLQAAAAGLRLPPIAAVLGFGGATLLIGFSLAIAGRNMRRFFSPLDALLEASDRLAAGEGGVQVPERGGPEVRALIRSFNSMSQQIQLQSEERKDLLADVTHELRTPLTVIQGGIEGMLDGVYDRDDPQLIDLLAEIRRMSELIEDLRTLALAERGALRFRLERTDLYQLASEIIATYRSQAEAEGIVVELKADGELPLVEVDPARIGQVLSNLLVNAFRYTPAGGQVRVTLQQVPTNEVRIEVSDTGAGIQDTDLPHIFDRLYRSPDSEGSGLGLAIAKQLVLAHGGQIKAESIPGSGTTISILLPA